MEDSSGICDSLTTSYSSQILPLKQRRKLAELSEAGKGRGCESTEGSTAYENVHCTGEGIQLECSHLAKTSFSEYLGRSMKKTSWIGEELHVLVSNLSRRQ